MKRYGWMILATILTTPVGAWIRPPELEQRLVSIVVGCLEVPTGAQVVMTENYRDAWMGYVQLPQDPRQVRWASGMIASRIGSGNYASAKAASGDDIRYVAVSSNGKPGFVARTGMVEFTIDGGTDSDIQYLLSVARRLRTDVPREACERPQIGKPAF